MRKDISGIGPVIEGSNPRDMIACKIFFKMITHPYTASLNPPDQQERISYIETFEMIHFHMDVADSYMTQHYQLQCLTFDSRRFDSSGTPMN